MSRRVVRSVAPRLAPVICLAFGLAACGTSDKDANTTYPTDIPGSNRTDPTPKAGQYDQGGVFGQDGITLFGGSGGGKDAGGGGIGVNGYLWRASLDTLSFMPLSSVDPFGGVIITDWYASEQVPNERFKMTVYILDKRLRADGVKVAVFRQVRAGPVWSDAPSDPETSAKLENAILTRARQLKVGTEK